MTDIITFDEEIFRNNLKILKNETGRRNLSLSIMMKHQLLSLYFIQNILFEDGVKIYTTSEDFGEKAHCVYSGKSSVIVDIYDKREGIEARDIKKISDRKEKTAIVNFFCGNKKIPTYEEVEKICNELRDEFKAISLGGSMMLWYNNRNYDEIRVGECLLTGYSTVFNQYYDGLKNPFTIDAPVWINRYGRVLVKNGFLSYGGFTNIKPLSVNTDVTVFDEKDVEWSSKIGYIVLRPDYFTLMKLANNREFDLNEIK